MADKHTGMNVRPRALTIEALRYGGYAVREVGCGFRGPDAQDHVAAFTRLTDAVGWIEEQMRLPEPSSDAMGHILRKA